MNIISWLSLRGLEMLLLLWRLLPAHCASDKRFARLWCGLPSYPRSLAVALLVKLGSGRVVRLGASLSAGMVGCTVLCSELKFSGTVTV